MLISLSKVLDLHPIKLLKLWPFRSYTPSLIIPERDHHKWAGLDDFLLLVAGYGALRGMGNFGISPREASYSPTTRFRNPMNYLSSGQACSSGQMSPIAEIRSQNVGKNVSSPEGGGFDEDHGNNYDTGYPLGSWDDSGLNALEAEVSLSISTFPPFLPIRLLAVCVMIYDVDQEVQGSRGSPTLLAHHLSLPESSSEIERLLPIQDSVPCKIRAKRGCATHPRSIAERVKTDLYILIFQCFPTPPTSKLFDYVCGSFRSEGPKSVKE